MRRVTENHLYCFAFWALGHELAGGTGRFMAWWYHRCENPHAYIGSSSVGRTRFDANRSSERPFCGLPLALKGERDLARVRPELLA